MAVTLDPKAKEACIVLMTMLYSVENQDKLAGIIQNDVEGGTSLLLDDWTKLQLNTRLSPFKVTIKKQGMMPRAEEKLIWIQIKK